MRAVRCPEGKPTVVDLPEPSGEGIVVTVASAGICGSDLHLLNSAFRQHLDTSSQELSPTARPLRSNPSIHVLFAKRALMARHNFACVVHQWPLA